MKKSVNMFATSMLIMLLLLPTFIGACAAPESSPEIAPAQTTTPTSSSEIQWDEARYHIGENVIVCGLVADTDYAFGASGKPTFLNIGKPYPDPERLIVIIYIQNRQKFSQPPEIYFKNKNICVTGLLTENMGILQIEVTDSSQIVVQ